MSIGDQVSNTIGMGEGGFLQGIPVMTILLFVVVLIVVGGITGFLLYLYIMKKQFKYKIQIFERINGRYQPTKVDFAKKTKLNTGGDEVITLRKGKKTLPMPSIQTGTNTYWYYISDDGEWINFGPGDFDEDRRELGADMLDKEMRYARTSLQYMTRDRYDQLSWWQRNAGWIVPLITFMVMGIVMFLIVREFSNITSGAQAASEASKEAMEKAKEVMSSMENVCQGGSGYESS